MIDAEHLTTLCAADDGSAFDHEHLALIVEAVNALVPRTVPRIREAPMGTPWPPEVEWAAYTMGQRLYARRNSPTGVAGYDAMGGGAVFISRWDPDLERTLGIGEWTPARIA